MKQIRLARSVVFDPWTDDISLWYLYPLKERLDNAERIYADTQAILFLHLLSKHPMERQIYCEIFSRLMAV